MNLITNTDTSELTLRVDLRPSITSFAADNGLSFDDVVGIIEDRYVSAAQNAHGEQYDFRAELSEDGHILVFQVLDVVENVQDGFRQVSLENAQSAYTGVELGGHITNPIEPVEPENVFEGSAARKINVQKMELRAAST